MFIRTYNNLLIKSANALKKNAISMRIPSSRLRTTTAKRPNQEKNKSFENKLLLDALYGSSSQFWETLNTDGRKINWHVELERNQPHQLQKNATLINAVKNNIYAEYGVYQEINECDIYQKYQKYLLLNIYLQQQKTSCPSR